MPGQKAMTVVMRLFLRKLHGWYRAGEAFNEERHFTCSASYTEKKAA